MKQLNNRTIIITANLPYLTTKQWRACPPDVRLYEPRAALGGGKDGLDFYRELFHQLTSKGQKGWKSSKGLNKSICPSSLSGFSGLSSFILILEIDPTQSKAITALALQNFPDAKIEIKKDLAGRDRLVIVTLKRSFSPPLPPKSSPR